MSEGNDNFILPKNESWKMFDRISPKYDFLNRVLSFGLDVRWRKKLIKGLRGPQIKTALDLATGTADVLLTLLRANRHIQSAVGLDMSDKMLEIGRKKVADAGLANKIILQHGDAHQIPYDTGHFDCVTIAFGIRNMKDPTRVLLEIRRVLKQGGRAAILEFSLPKGPMLRRLHLLYLRQIVPTIGARFSGDAQAYRYLNQTIEAFPYGEEFCQFMRSIGFQNVTARPLLFGTATIYEGLKP